MRCQANTSLPESLFLHSAIVPRHFCQIIDFRGILSQDLLIFSNISPDFNNHQLFHGEFDSDQKRFTPRDWNRVMISDGLKK